MHGAAEPVPDRVVAEGTGLLQVALDGPVVAWTTRVGTRGIEVVVDDGRAAESQPCAYPAVAFSKLAETRQRLRARVSQRKPSIAEDPGLLRAREPMRSARRRWNPNRSQR